MLWVILDPQPSLKSDTIYARSLGCFATAQVSLVIAKVLHLGNVIDDGKVLKRVPEDQRADYLLCILRTSRRMVEPGGGACAPPLFLAGQLTLFQPRGGQIMSPQILRPSIIPEREE